LDAKLGARLGHLARAGCATLEIGLETLDWDVQRAIAKRQRHEVFFEVLDEARRSGIRLVVNYITGFPKVDHAEEDRCRYFVEEAVVASGAKFEHNTFQLERTSPMGRAPDAHGMRVTRASPWSSVLEWEHAQKLVRLVRKATI
jgi:hypothetical protein